MTVLCDEYMYNVRCAHTCTSDFSNQLMLLFEYVWLMLAQHKLHVHVCGIKSTGNYMQLGSSWPAY